MHSTTGAGVSVIAGAGTMYTSTSADAATTVGAGAIAAGAAVAASAAAPPVAPSCEVRDDCHESLLKVMLRTRSKKWKQPQAIRHGRDGTPDMPHYKKTGREASPRKI